VQGAQAANERAAQLDKQKNDSATQDRANKDQKHAQDMELGGLDVQQKKLAVAQAAVSLANAASEHEKPAGEAEKGGGVQPPAEDPEAKAARITSILSAIKFDDGGKADANAAALMQGLGHVADLVVAQGAAHSAKIDTLTQATLAPVKILRGPDGRAIGSQKVLQ
jgi:hypothetical protein